MRLLHFLVKGQAISKDSTCDFSNIVAGTRGYLFAKFSFDASWNSYVKVAIFNDAWPVRLDAHNKCEIPAEVLKANTFNVRVMGISKTGRVKTNNCGIMQVR